MVEFESTLNKGLQFEREYFHGGTLMNAIEPIKDVDPEFLERLEFVEKNVNTNAIVDFPTELLVFQDCDANTAMCCWTADRDSVETVNDNTDVCYVEMNQMPGTQRASRVLKGSALYFVNDEGPVHCHGFTWDGSTDKFKGNLLFEVAVSHGTLDHGFVKGIPGGPMCGCVEQVGVVYKSEMGFCFLLRPPQICIHLVLQNAQTHVQTDAQGFEGGLYRRKSENQVIVSGKPSDGIGGP